MRYTWLMELHRDENQCCGNCLFHEKIDGRWTCTQPGSEYAYYETEYTDVCDEWEER